MNIPSILRGVVYCFSLLLVANVIGAKSLTFKTRCSSLQQIGWSNNLVEALYPSAELFPWFLDSDGDGFGDPTISLEDSIAPENYVADNSDCNDHDSSIYPGAAEVCNNLDDNCNGDIDEGVQSTFYADVDADGFGNAASSILACTAPQGYVIDQTDCNDTDASINPNVLEICNEVDDNCNGQIDEGVKSTFYADSDGDGFGDIANSILACVAPQGYVSNNTDCNDANPSVNQNASESCNTVDDNCDGQIDEGVKSTFYADNDADGFGDLSNSIDACTAPLGFVTDYSDCNDVNNLIHPGATETCNGLDDDCSGQIDDNLSAGGISILWQKTYGGAKADIAQGMDYTLDGGFVIAGKSLSNNGDVTINHGKNDLWIVKIDGGGTLLWQKAYGGTGDDIANAVKATADGGYIVAGSSASGNGDVAGNHGGTDWWVIKLDGNGNLIWQKCFGGSSQEIAYDVDLANDGGYIIGGYTKSSDGDVTGNHSSGDYWIVKTDANGNLQWQKTYGGSGYDFAHAVCHTTDGGYLVSGYARSSDGDVTVAYGQEDVWILKLDQNGNILWQKTYGGTGGEGASSLQQTTDGGYILAGITHSFNIDIVGNHGTEHDFWVVKIDANGNKQWTKCLGGSDTEDGHMIRQTSDGGYLVCGNGDSHDGDATYNNGGHDYWVVKINASGSIQWQKSLGGSLDDEAYGALETSDGNFITAGYATSNDDDVNGNHGSSDFWVAKCSAPSHHTFFADADGDTYGNVAVSVQACSAPPGYVSNSSDCNDANANVNPGAFENCNGIDDNCNSQIDENSIIATITPLATITICKTSVVTFQCNTSPSYSYKWLKNGVAITGATNSTYSTSSPGTYSVVITQGLCSANSPATILKNTSGIVKVTPQGTTTVCPKIPVHFSVPESPGMAFQWYNTTGIIPGATSFNISTTIPGSYFVNETDITGCSFNSSTSTLKNSTGATATISASGSLNICSTGSVTLNAAIVTGQTYQWYKDGATVAGATSTTFIATQVGAYKFLATSTNGCTTFSQSKNVKGCKSEDTDANSDLKPKIEVYPNPSDGTFTCSFRLQNDFSGTGQIIVCNALGQILFARDAEIANGYYSGQISLPPEISQGFYFLRFSCQQNESVAAITVTR